MWREKKKSTEKRRKQNEQKQRRTEYKKEKKEDKVWKNGIYLRKIAHERTVLESTEYERDRRVN